MSTMQAMTRQDLAQIDSDVIATDPPSHGFTVFAGYAVRAPDGRYVREWRVLRPRAGLYLTAKDGDALLFPQRCNAQWLAGKIKGAEVAEAWDSPRQRLMRWGPWATH